MQPPRRCLGAGRCRHKNKKHWGGAAARPAAAQPRRSQHCTTRSLPSNVTSAVCPVTPAAAVWGKAAAAAKGVGRWVSMEGKAGRRGDPPTAACATRLRHPARAAWCKWDGGSRKCGRRGQALSPLASWHPQAWRCARRGRRCGCPCWRGTGRRRCVCGTRSPGSRAGARLFHGLVRCLPPTHASNTGLAPVDWSSAGGCQAPPECPLVAVSTRHLCNASAPRVARLAPHRKARAIRGEPGAAATAWREQRRAAAARRALSPAAHGPHRGGVGASDHTIGCRRSAVTHRRRCVLVNRPPLLSFPWSAICVCPRLEA